MKGLVWICIFMFLSCCGCSGEIGRDTVLKEVRIVTESPFFIADKEENTTEIKEENTDEEETDYDETDYDEELPDESFPEVVENAGEEEMESDYDKEPQESIYESVNNTESNFNDVIKTELMRKQQDLYAYSALEITQQNLYVEILYALENYVEEMEVSTLDTEEIDNVYQCVLLDHPELFYTDGYSFVKYTMGEEIKKITFKGTYIYNREEKEQLQSRILESAQNMLQGISMEASDYDKVKYVYETVIEQTEYSREAKDNQNICSVFLGHASVCQGYAKAVQYLLQILNIPTTLVIGTVENEGHAWNLVKMNNQYYYVDATWGDASYLNNSSEETLSTPSINYDYLCVTTEDILRTHSLGNLVPLPVCDAKDCNYYVMEGAYFTQVDYTQLENLIAEYKMENRESVTIKCADDFVYREMVQNLLEEQKIFRYLESPHHSIVYTESEKQRSLTFWL